MSKAERRAKHAEEQRRLWETADQQGDQNRSYFLESQGIVPLKDEFKAPVKVLARKPTPSIAKREGGPDLAKLALEDEDDSEEEARKKREADFETRRQKAKLEREEKEKKYAEARERIMGSPVPGTPASNNSRESSRGGDMRKQRGRGSGHAGSNGSRPGSGRQSPSRSVMNGDAQVFDPEDMGRRFPPRREMTPKEPKEGEPMRQPRNPEQGVRGGFGFGARGGKAA